MNEQIRIGDRARTAGPLKPFGRIRVKGFTIDAGANGEWIDADTEVVIIGGNRGRAEVRVVLEKESPVVNHGHPLPQPTPSEETPLQFPQAWVERVPAAKVGLCLGMLGVPILWLAGHPIAIDALLLPLAGLVSGWLFRIFVGHAAEFAGPRQDHRPQALLTAAMVFLGVFIGTAIGLDAGTYLGASCGLLGGTVAGGVLVYVGGMILLWV